MNFGMSLFSYMKFTVNCFDRVRLIVQPIIMLIEPKAMLRSTVFSGIRNNTGLLIENLMRCIASYTSGIIFYENYPKREDHRQRCYHSDKCL